MLPNADLEYCFLRIPGIKMSVSDTLTPPEALTVRAFRSLDELRELSTTWDELLAEYPLATTFSSSAWLSSWWHSFGKGRQLLVLAGFDSDSRLIGLAPLSISRERYGGFPGLRVLRLMGDGSGDSDNLDLPARPRFEAGFAQAVLWYLVQQKRDWDICQLNSMPVRSPMANALVDLLKPSWLMFEHSERCSSIPLPETWEGYLQLLSSEDRKNLDRYTRRVQKRYSTRVYRCTRESELPVCLDALFRLHQLRWQKAGQPGSFGSVERCEFYQRLSRTLLDRGQLEMWVLELDGVIAATQFAFRFGDRVFQLQEGYDPERSSDRVGFILRGAVIKQLILEKARSYDFLGGVDPYKAAWGAQPGKYRNLHFARPFSLGGIVLRAVHHGSEGKQWLRDNLPGSVWNLLHKINVGLRPGHEQQKPAGGLPRSPRSQS
jgi:CelD/BcsL family acetyltransferase involved in cellulose biosynthesis